MDSVSDTGSDSSHLLQPQTEKEYGFQRPRQSFVKRHRRSLLWGSLSLLAVLVIVITYISTSIRSRRNSFVPSSKLSKTNSRFPSTVIDQVNSAMGSSPFHSGRKILARLNGSQFSLERHHAAGKGVRQGTGRPATRSWGHPCPERWIWRILLVCLPSDPLYRHAARCSQQFPYRQANGPSTQRARPGSTRTR